MPPLPLFLMGFSPRSPFFLWGFSTAPSPRNSPSGCPKLCGICSNGDPQTPQPQILPPTPQPSNPPNPSVTFPYGPPFPMGFLYGDPQPQTPQSLQDFSIGRPNPTTPNPPQSLWDISMGSPPPHRISPWGPQTPKVPLWDFPWDAPTPQPQIPPSPYGTFPWGPPLPTGSLHGDPKPPPDPTAQTL